MLIGKNWIIIGKCVEVEMEIWNMGSFAAYAVPKYKKIKEKKRIYCDSWLGIIPTLKIKYDVGFKCVCQK